LDITHDEFDIAADRLDVRSPAGGEVVEHAHVVATSRAAR